MAKIGFVGLGMMGSRMVTRLMEAGHTVTGYNRTKSRAEELITKLTSERAAREKAETKLKWAEAWIERAALSGRRDEGDV